MMSLKIELGAKFICYEDVEEALALFEREQNITYWKRHSRSLQSASRKIDFQNYNADNFKLKLKYYEVSFCCLKGGRKFSSCGTGVRPNQSTFREACGSHVTLKGSKDLKYLIVISVSTYHSHIIPKESFNFLPKKRRLNEEEIEDLKNIIINKYHDSRPKNKILKKYILQKTGKMVTSRDLTNILKKFKPNYELTKILKVVKKSTSKYSTTPKITLPKKKVLSNFIPTIVRPLPTPDIFYKNYEQSHASLPLTINCQFREEENNIHIDAEYTDLLRKKTDTNSELIFGHYVDVDEMKSHNNRCTANLATVSCTHQQMLQDLRLNYSDLCVEQPSYSLPASSSLQNSDDIQVDEIKKEIMDYEEEKNELLDHSYHNEEQLIKVEVIDDNYFTRTRDTNDEEEPTFNYSDNFYNPVEEEPISDYTDTYSNANEEEQFSNFSTSLYNVIEENETNDYDYRKLLET